MVESPLIGARPFLNAPMGRVLVAPVTVLNVHASFTQVTYWQLVSSDGQRR